MITKTVSIAAAFIAATIASTGLAQAAPDPDAGSAHGSADAAPAPQESARDLANDHRRFCRDRPSSGAVMPSRICRTRAQWARMGVRISASERP